jgi:hypothetical protein
MPWTDWQFWLVTMLALGGLWILLRPFIPLKKRADAGASCPHCASGSASSKPRRVALTVEKRRL